MDEYYGLMRVLDLTAVVIDILSMVSCTVATVIFYRRWSTCPLYLLLLAQSIVHLSLAVLDSVVFVRREMKIMFGNVEDYVIWPLYWYLYFVQCWLVILVVLERWSKHRNVGVWSHMNALRRLVAVLIAGLAFTMIYFFRPIFERQPGGYYFDLVGNIILPTAFLFVIPFLLIIGFVAATACRVFTPAASNNTITNNNYRVSIERSRTIAVFGVAISFVSSNTLIYVVFLSFTFVRDWETDNYAVYMILYEVAVIATSVDSFADTALIYTIFLQDYRRAFIDMFRNVLTTCGYKRRAPRSEGGENNQQHRLDGGISEAGVSYRRLLHGPEEDKTEVAEGK